MKIYSAYKTTDRPWGGANNFLRALCQELIVSHDVSLVDDPASADIIFFNQMSSGPGAGSKAYSLADIRKIKKINPAAKIVVRAINLEKIVRKMPFWKYFLSGSYKKDNTVVRILNDADHVIYQSRYQKKLFEQNGVPPQKSTVIHNGAARIFRKTYPRPALTQAEDMIVLCVSFSGGKHKNHEDVAALSKVDGVVVHYVGNWPSDVNPANIILKGVLGHDALIELSRHAHYLFHPSTHDICPNSVIEALHSGIPVIYNDALETGFEVCGDCGLFYDPTDLPKTVSNARLSYNSLVEKLSDTFQTYGIDTTAKEYHAVFRSVVGA